MNMITVPFDPVIIFKSRVFPLNVSSKLKFGAAVPKASILLSVLAILLTLFDKVKGIFSAMVNR